MCQALVLAMPEFTKKIIASSIIQPEWITEARDEWKKDEEVWTCIQNLQQALGDIGGLKWAS